MRRCLETVLWWLVLTGLWLTTVTTPTLPEVVAAALFAVPCAFAAGAARRVAGDRWRLRVFRVGVLSKLPVAVLHDLARVFASVRPGHEGRFDHLHLPVEHDEDARATNEAFASTMLSSTPGTVVVDADRDHQTLLIHRLDGDTNLERSVRR